MSQGEHTGLQVSNSVEIDHAKLGRHFFDWDNVEQARFLHGAALGLDGLGGYGHSQLKYIVDAAAADGTLVTVREFVELLHVYLKEAK